MELVFKNPNQLKPTVGNLYVLKWNKESENFDPETQQETEFGYATTDDGMLVYGVVGYAEIPDELYVMVQTLHNQMIICRDKSFEERDGVIKQLQTAPMKLGHEIYSYTIKIGAQTIPFYIVEKKNSCVLYLDLEILLKALGCHVSAEVEAMELEDNINRWDISVYNQETEFAWDELKVFLLRLLKQTNRIK